MKYINTINQIIVGSLDDNTTFEECIRVKLEDAGMFLIFQQNSLDRQHEIRISFDEWINICEAVSSLKHQPMVK